MTIPQTAESASVQLREHASPEDARFLQGYFKTGPGEYGEGDIFIGVRVPVVRKVARQLKAMPLPEVGKLLTSSIHEERLLAVILLTLKYPKADAETQKELCDFYLDHTRYVNNWDLVDSSAHKLLGPFLLHKPKDLLYRLAESELIWERRIAIMTTLEFIRHEQFDDTLNISRILLEDDHDLIHKAVGWMLREVGNRDRGTEEQFLNQYYARMPRTMLRYAIEKFPTELRQAYLKGFI